MIRGTFDIGEYDEETQDVITELLWRLNMLTANNELVYEAGSSNERILDLLIDFDIIEFCEIEK